MQPIQKLNIDYADNLFELLVLRLKNRISNYWVFDIKLGKEKYTFDISSEEATLLSYDCYINKFEKILVELGFESCSIMNKTQLKTDYLLIKANLPYKFI